MDPNWKTPRQRRREAAEKCKTQFSAEWLPTAGIDRIFARLPHINVEDAPTIRICSGMDHVEVTHPDWPFRLMIPTRGGAKYLRELAKAINPYLNTFKRKPNARKR